MTIRPGTPAEHLDAVPPSSAPSSTLQNPAQQSPDQSRPAQQHPTRQRLAWIDNLRIWLTALVVLHHVAFTYAPYPAWPYHEPDNSPQGILLLLFGVVNQMWFMSAFFLLSGVFVPGSYERKGAARFVRDRLIRLGIPLVAFVLLIRPLVDGYNYPAARDGAGGDLSFGMYYLQTMRPIWMWFVAVLLIMCVVYACVRALREHRALPGTTTTPGTTTERSADQGAQTPAPTVSPATTRAHRLSARPVLLFAAGLVVAMYLWRIAVPSSTYWPVIGMPTPDHLPLYVAFFVVGTLALRRGWADSLTPRAGWIGAGVALVGVVVQLVLVLQPESAGGGTWQSFVVVLGLVPTAIGATIAALALFRARFARQGRVSRFLSAHAFTVYVMHGVVLVAFGMLLAPVQAPGLVKFALLALVALPACWGLGWAIRKIPGAKRIL